MAGSALKTCRVHSAHRSSRRTVNDARVMRVWRVEPGFATYHCERCGESGYVRDRHAPAPDPVRLAKAQAEAAERDRVSASEVNAALLDAARRCGLVKDEGADAVQATIASGLKAGLKQRHDDLNAPTRKASAATSRQTAARRRSVEPAAISKNLAASASRTTWRP